MEFTPEQQAHIDSIISEKTQGLFTEDDLQKKVTSEVDRRVESGIQKGLETHKSKWEKEFKTKAQLTAEELAQKELEDKFNELSSREKEIYKKSNTIDAKDMLTNAGIPKAQYEKFMDLLVSDDTESTTINVNNFIDNFNTTKSEIESKLKKELSNIPPPKNNSDGNGAISKEEFDGMGYAKKMELKAENPDLFNKFIQNN